MIFHLTDPAVWLAQSAGQVFTESTRGATLDHVGFIHCSYNDQVELVANAIFSDWVGDLLLLAIDPDHLTAPIKVENLDGGALQFPHVYGPIPITAVRAVHRMDRDAEGWHLPQLGTT